MLLLMLNVSILSQLLNHYITVFRHDLQVKSRELATEFNCSWPFTDAQHRRSLSSHHKVSPRPHSLLVNPGGGSPAVFSHQILLNFYELSTRRPGPATFASHIYVLHTCTFSGENVEYLQGLLNVWKQIIWAIPDCRCMVMESLSCARIHSVMVSL